MRTRTGVQFAFLRLHVQSAYEQFAFTYVYEQFALLGFHVTAIDCVYNLATE